MHIPFTSKLTALTATLTVAIGAPGVTAQQDIVTTAVKAGNFETLVTAVKAAKLVSTLQGDGPFTVFAPTDAAFAKLDQHVLGGLLKRKNRGTLSGILTFHVVPGKLAANDVLGRTSLDTVNGQRLPVVMDGDTVTVGGAGLVATDIRCSNGIIHVIDTVMMPASDTIPAIAKAAGSFQTLLAAAKAAKLVDTLSGKGPLTVLAPTDDAFAQLPKGTVKNLLRPENRRQLARILSYHVVPGRIYADQAITAGAAKTATGDPVRFSIAGGRLQVEGTNIVGTDIDAKNGVVHVIDRVLMPPKPARPAGRLVIGVNIERPSSALAAQLGIDRNKTLLVTGLTKGGGAERAGLKRYDILTGFDGMPATDANLSKAKEAAGYEGKVEVNLIRRGKHRDLEIPVGVSKH
ncbi:MAG: fasciclin domain-containing protein [bacterium]|nr:fasciclin domain-containing protein [bacterium]